MHLSHRTITAWYSRATIECFSWSITFQLRDSIWRARLILPLCSKDFWARRWNQLQVECVFTRVHLSVDSRIAQKTAEQISMKHDRRTGFSPEYRDLDVAPYVLTHCVAVAPRLQFCCRPRSALCILVFHELFPRPTEFLAARLFNHKQPREEERTHMSEITHSFSCT